MSPLHHLLKYRPVRRVNEHIDRRAPEIVLLPDIAARMIDQQRDRLLVLPEYRDMQRR